MSKIITVCLLLISILSYATSQAKEPLRQTPDTTKPVSVAAIPPIIQGDSVAQKVIVGKFVKTNEDGDYWYFYISEKKGKEVKFIYNSEDILKIKKGFEGKILKVKYIEKEFEEAGSGDKFTEKFLQSVEIQK